ncbi:MAG: hypothetical protein K0S44_666 [Bacteroidetes bacterium]|nr:hypothetical protein [Bacteroidota bacterium]
MPLSFFHRSLFLKSSVLLLFIFFAVLTCRADSLSKKNNVSLLNITAGYRCPMNKANILNSGHGLYFEAGINAGYFLPNKLQIVLFGGWGWKDRLWTTGFNQIFLNDINISFSDNQLSSNDSMIVNSFHEELNNNEKKTISFPSCKTNTFHNSSFYYGISFGLPFKKYHTVIKVYRGTTRSSFTGNDRSDSGKEYNLYEIRRNMNGIELSLFPGFKRTLKDKFFGTPLFSHLGMVSFYYERINFSSSVLYFTDGDQRQTIKLSEFLNYSFLNKYKFENVFGVKICWSVY